MADFAFADELQQACRFCATFARARVEGWWRHGFVPKPQDLTATVSFVAFEGCTYAVTAGHVIDIFREAAIREGADPEGYFLPVAPGIAIHPPFIRPPKPWTAPAPDIALRPIDPDLPPHIGKQAFALKPEPVQPFPVPYALAAGFPTASKVSHGDRVALPCVHVVAQGIESTSESDQIQFWSELRQLSEIESLSGLSGGPVFWSDGTTHGLLGFVKEALDVRPTNSEQTFYSDPRVHFLCQRATYETFGEWAAYADREFPKQREAQNARVARISQNRKKIEGSS